MLLTITLRKIGSRQALENIAPDALEDLARSYKDETALTGFLSLVYAPNAFDAMTALWFQKSKARNIIRFTCLVHDHPNSALSQEVLM